MEKNEDSRNLINKPFGAMGENMISKKDLVKLTRNHLGFTQTVLAEKMRYSSNAKISDLENDREDLTYARLCQLYVVYCRFGKPNEQIDNIFNNYIDIMFKG